MQIVLHVNPNKESQGNNNIIGLIWSNQEDVFWLNHWIVIYIYWSGSIKINHWPNIGIIVSFTGSHWPMYQATVKLLTIMQRTKYKKPCSEKVLIFCIDKIFS